MPNCNICAVSHCHKNMVDHPDGCRSFMPLDTFKLSLLEIAMAEHPISVVRVLTAFGAEIEPNRDRPYFTLAFGVCKK